MENLEHRVLNATPEDLRALKEEAKKLLAPGLPSWVHALANLQALDETGLAVVKEVLYMDECEEALK